MAEDVDVVVLGMGPGGEALASRPVPGLAHTPYWTNRDAVTTGTVPESLVVLADVLTAEGLSLHTSAAAERVGHDGTDFTVRLADIRLRARRLLVATGRRADLEAVGLAELDREPRP